MSICLFHFFVDFELPIIHITVWKCFFAFSVIFAVFPLSIVCKTVWICIFASSISLVVLPLTIVLMTVWPCWFSSTMPFAIEHVSSVRWFGAARHCDFVVLNLNSCHLSCLWKYLCQFIWDELNGLGPDRRLNYLLVNFVLVHRSD